MNRVLLLGMLCLSVELNVVAQQMPTVPLPADGSAVIIMFDVRGGGPIRQPRKNMAPLLTVRADGSVTAMVDGQGVVPDAEVKLPAERIQELLRFIVTDQRFFDSDLTSEEIWRAITAETVRKGRGTMWADVSDTVVRIRTADAEKEIIFNGVANYARDYPSVPALSRLLAVETRLGLLYQQLRSATVLQNSK